MTQMLIKKFVTVAVLVGGISIAFASASAPGFVVSSKNFDFVGHVRSTESWAAGRGSRLVVPITSPQRGMGLFTSKGCVACHAINGVGGHDTPALDAHRTVNQVNLFDFAAKLWNHHPLMISPGKGLIGERIIFAGEELADIMAFVNDDEVQHTFTEADLTPEERGIFDHDHGSTTAHKAHAEEIGHHPPRLRPARLD